MAEQEKTREEQRKILISVDGSCYSERAFKFYLSDVCRSGDIVYIFHVVDLQITPALDYSPGFAYYESWLDSVKTADHEAKLLLRHFGDLLKVNDIKFILVKQTGSPGELICHMADMERCTYVVLGSRGQGIVRRTFLGSVSDYVVHHSHIPVLIVPPKKPDH